MKANLKKLIGTAVLGVSLYSHSLPAWAGYTYSRDVLITADSAQGNTARARYSTDSQQYIGCSFSNTNGPFVVCSAQDKTGKSLVCTSTNPKLGAVAKAMTDFSTFLFYLSSSNPSSCSSLYVTNGSSSLR